MHIQRHSQLLRHGGKEHPLYPSPGHPHPPQFNPLSTPISRRREYKGELERVRDRGWLDRLIYQKGACAIYSGAHDFLLSCHTFPRFLSYNITYRKRKEGNLLMFNWVILRYDDSARERKKYEILSSIQKR